MPAKLGRIEAEGAKRSRHGGAGMIADQDDLGRAAFIDDIDRGRVGLADQRIRGLDRLARLGVSNMAAL